MPRHGLLTQQQAPAPGATAPTPEPTDGERPNVSPEEQAIYDQFVDNALSAIYDDKSLPQIIESLKGDGNPVDGLANTAVNVVVRVQDSAEQADQAISPDVVFNAGIEILEDLAELAATAGVHEFTAQEVEGATFQAMAAFDEFAADDDTVTPPAEGQEDGNKADAAASAETTDQAPSGGEPSDDADDDYSMRKTRKTMKKLTTLFF